MSEGNGGRSAVQRPEFPILHRSQVAGAFSVTRLKAVIRYRAVASRPADQTEAV